MVACLVAVMNNGIDILFFPKNSRYRPLARSQDPRKKSIKRYFIPPSNLSIPIIEEYRILMSKGTTSIRSGNT
jgi:hypothetical protein